MQPIKLTKPKKIKTKEKWALLKAKPYYEPNEDFNMKKEYYKPLFEILSPSEIDFITNKKHVKTPVRRKEIYKILAHLHKKNFKHARRRPILFDLIDRRPDGSLKCLYTDTILEENEDEWTHLSQMGEIEPTERKPKLKFDEEHTFPQSYQSGTKLGTGRDMHQMFAVSKSANGKRGNKAFGVGCSNRKITEYGVYSKSGKMKFYSPKENKSVAARAFLYIMQGYPGCLGSERFPRGAEAWVVKHGSQENVSLWEKHRNFLLHSLQGNRNPFIDFPKLALIIDFNDSWRDNDDGFDLLP
jgi:hypothetical protein